MPETATDQLRSDAAAWKRQLSDWLERHQISPVGTDIEDTMRAYQVAMSEDWDQAHREDRRRRADRVAEHLGLPRLTCSGCAEPRPHDDEDCPGCCTPAPGCSGCGTTSSRRIAGRCGACLIR